VQRVVEKQTAEQFAMKIIKKSYLKKDEKMDLKSVLDILVDNEHKNVTNVIEYYQDKKFYYVVYEYNQGGLLFDYMAESQYFNDKTIACIVKQILSALMYNQAKEIFHKELRPENLMIDDPLLDIPSVKINDFSTSVEYMPKDKKGRKMRKTTFSCLYFMPPEVVGNWGYNENSDIWSIGLIILLLVTGEWPIKGASNKATLNNIKTNKINIKQMIKEGKISEELGTLLEKMLEFEPQSRISAVDAINDPWVIKYSKNEDIEITANHPTKEKFKSFWNYYYLQYLWMQYFGVYSLDNIYIDQIKEQAGAQGKKDSDTFTYEELLEILTKVFDNTKDTIVFIINNSLREMNLDEGRVG